MAALGTPAPVARRPPSIALFLVSVKLVIMSYKNAIASDDVKTELRRLREALAERERE